MISTPYTIYCNRGGRDSAVRYTGSVLLHQIVMSLLCSVGILALAAGIYFSGAMPGLAPVMVALAGMLPLLMLRSFVRQALIAHLDLTAAIVLDLAVAALQLGGLVALGAAGRLTAPVAYLVMGTACGVAVVAWFAIVRPSLSFSFSQSIADWRRNWAFAKWVVASNLAGSAAVYAVPWILGASSRHRRHGTAGRLLEPRRACQHVHGRTGFLLDSQGARSFAQRGLPGLMSVLWKSTAFIAILLSVMCVFFAVAGGPLAAIIYKGKYAGAGPIVTVLGGRRTHQQSRKLSRPRPVDPRSSAGEPGARRCALGRHAGRVCRSRATARRVGRGAGDVGRKPRRSNSPHMVVRRGTGRGPR